MDWNVSTGRAVVFRGDGEPRESTRELIDALTRIDTEKPIDGDNYSLGGVVEELEFDFARRLGKEAAMFVPSGTLANHLAVRRHCSERRRCLIQEQSHLYQDCGDCVPVLSGINLVPIARGRADVSVEDLETAQSTASAGRVRTSIGAIVIESPVRRQAGQIVPMENLEALSSWSRSHDIRTHLDGARLYMMTAATGIDPATYAALFDSVYVSLYKYFGAPFGAILAGSTEFIGGLYHDRRMFGGGLASSALAAALALDGAADFETKLAKAFAHARVTFELIDRLPGLSLQPFEHGSNIWPLRIDESVDLTAFLSALSERDIQVRIDPMFADFVPMTINTTILKQSPQEIASAFEAALA